MREGGAEGGVLDVMHGRNCITIETFASLQRRDGARRDFTEQTLLAPSARRREVSSESHEG